MAPKAPSTRLHLRDKSFSNLLVERVVASELILVLPAGANCGRRKGSGEANILGSNNLVIHSQAWLLISLVRSLRVIPLMFSVSDRCQFAVTRDEDDELRVYGVALLF